MRLALFALVLLFLGTFLRADTFDLGFEIPSGSPSPLYCTLTHAGSGPGAQGWAFGVTAENASIAGLTVAGTQAAALFNAGFVYTRLTTGPGNEGAVEAVVLSFTLPITLPTNANSRIAVMGLAPGGAGGFVTLRYVDGLKAESSAPTACTVTQDGSSISPSRAVKTFEIAPCTTLHVGFSTERLSSLEPFAGILGEKGSAAGAEIVTASGAATIFANIISELASGGVQGWSLSIGLSGDAELASVTTDGTGAAPFPDGFRSGGFERTEIVDPARNGGKNGVVSAVVLSLEPNAHLRPVGTESVLKLDVLLSSPSKRELSAALSFKDGLTGTGQPVSNLLTVEDDDRLPCNFATASVTLKSTRVPFLRGDSNGNGRVTISDAIHTLGHLFLGSHPSPECSKALDSNDDGAVNISDPLYTLRFLFLGGPPIAAPYPSCGNDPTVDGLGCESFSACE